MLKDSGIEGDKKIVKCDFCEVEISKELYDKGVNGWTWGQKGATYPSGAICMLERELKHSCPNELCKAKLLVWARS